MEHEVLGLLGLAKKAGKAALGEEETLSAALDHKARLILLACDASEHTTAKVERAAGTGSGFCFQTGLSKAELGGAVGKGSCAAVTFTDVGLAASAARKLARLDPERWGEAAETLSRKAAKTVRRRREKHARQKRTAKSAKPWVAPPGKAGEKR